MSARTQSLVVSLVIGLLLPAAIVSGLAWSIYVTVGGALALWVVKIIERKETDLLLPIIGLVIGFVIAVLTAPLLPIPEAALWMLLLALFV